MRPSCFRDLTIPSDARKTYEQTQRNDRSIEEEQKVPCQAEVGKTFFRRGDEKRNKSGYRIEIGSEGKRQKTPQVGGTSSCTVYVSITCTRYCIALTAKRKKRKEKTDGEIKALGTSDETSEIWWRLVRSEISGRHVGGMLQR